MMEKRTRETAGDIMVTTLRGDTVLAVPPPQNILPLPSLVKPPGIIASLKAAN